MIYTSYFAKLRTIPDSIKPIAISNSVPKNVTIPKLTMLAPAWVNVDRFKKKQIGWEEFERLYTEQLERLDFANLMQHVPKGDVVFLCYEKDPNVCHRVILARWLGCKLGCEITEW